MSYRLDNPLYKADFNTLDDVWDHYRKCCEQHDWFYEYADDHRYWKNGVKEEEYILKLKEHLGDVDKLSADAIYYNQSPFHNADGSIKDEYLSKVGS